MGTQNTYQPKPNINVENATLRVYKITFHQRANQQNWQNSHANDDIISINNKLLSLFLFHFQSTFVAVTFLYVNTGRDILLIFFPSISIGKNNFYWIK